jgi:hypothetical protein
MSEERARAESGMQGEPPNTVMELTATFAACSSSPCWAVEILHRHLIPT